MTLRRALQLVLFLCVVIGSASYGRRASAQQCVPPCRGGFVCYQGQCISACNPPCRRGEKCGPDGECVADPNGGAPNGRFVPPRQRRTPPPPPRAAPPVQRRAPPPPQAESYEGYDEYGNYYGEPAGSGIKSRVSVGFGYGSISSGGSAGGPAGGTALDVFVPSASNVRIGGRVALTNLFKNVGITTTRLFVGPSLEVGLPDSEVYFNPFAGMSAAVGTAGGVGWGIGTDIGTRSGAANGLIGYGARLEYGKYSRNGGSASLLSAQAFLSFTFDGN